MRSIKTKKIEIEDIGEVTLQIKPSVKRISIRVNPDHGVQVTMPDHVAVSRAIKFIDKKKSWIIKHLKNFRKLEKNRTLLDGQSVIALCNHNLIPLQHGSDNFRIRIAKGSIYVYHPENSKIQDPGFQEFIWKGVIEALRIEAKHFLPRRVEELAKIHGLNYRKVFIKNAQTRWGSCSTKMNINLNLHLMRLPSYLRDYVILHELTHTVHPNHGKEFWAFLDGIAGNARGKEKELKKYQIQLF